MPASRKGSNPPPPAGPKPALQPQQFIALLMDQYGDYRLFGPGPLEVVKAEALEYAEENIEDSDMSQSSVKVYPIAGPAISFDIEQAGYRLVQR